MGQLFGQMGKIIPNDFYKTLAQNTNLGHLLRSLFSPIEDMDQIDYLIDELTNVQKDLFKLQDMVIKKVAQDSVIKNTRIRLIRDRSGYNAIYLRWRNIDVGSTGKRALNEVLSNPELPNVVRESLLAVNFECAILNTQIRALSNLIRSLSDTKDDIFDISYADNES